MAPDADPWAQRTVHLKYFTPDIQNKMTQGKGEAHCSLGTDMATEGTITLELGDFLERLETMGVLT
jgi:hypothetical protein